MKIKDCQYQKSIRLGKSHWGSSEEKSFFGKENRKDIEEVHRQVQSQGKEN